MSAELRDQLLAVKAKIATPSQWATRVYATDSDGWPVPVGSPLAACFCLEGAVRHAGNSPEVFSALISKAHDLYDSNSLSSINDNFGFTAVHAVLDAAIAEATEATKC